MKKVINIFIIILFILYVVNYFIPSQAYAAYACDDMISSAEGFLEASTESENPIDENSLRSVSDTIYNVFFAVALGISLIVGSYLGIKIMTGTIEEKAKIKEMLVPYIVGVFVIFTAFTIWKIVINIGNSVF